VDPACLSCLEQHIREGDNPVRGRRGRSRYAFHELTESVKAVAYRQARNGLAVSKISVNFVVFIPGESI